MNDDELVARLRRLEATDRASMLDPARVLAHGRRSRRRRLAGGAGAASLSIAAVAGLILALPHGGAESVVTPATAPTASPISSGAADIDPDATAHNAAILQKAMPDFGVAAKTAQGNLRSDRVDSAGLPAGWTANVQLRAALGDDPSLGSCDYGSGSSQYWERCLPRTLADGNVVSVETMQNKGSVAKHQILTVRFSRSDGVQTWARIQALPPLGSGSPDDNAAAFDWADSYADRLSALVTDPAVEPERRFDLDPDATRHNDALFASDLGPDFDLAGMEKGQVRPGTASAVGLPSGFSTMVFRGLGVSDEHVCDPIQYYTGCVDHTTADGKTVQERRGHFHDLGANGVAQRSVTVYYQRPDGLLVQVELRTMESSADMTTAREAKAQAWLEGLVDRLTRAATDSGIEPEPEPAPPAMPPTKCAATQAQAQAEAKGVATPPPCPVTNP